jgi:multiple antibiotic resistance protein
MKGGVNLGSGMQFSIYSTAITLTLVMDPLGNIPLFLSILKNYSAARQRKIILRETLIAFVVLVVFLFCGRFIMTSLNLEIPALSIAGGVVLFLIAVKMLFPGSEKEHTEAEAVEPFIVPLAIPLTAGPSALAVIMLYASRFPERVWSLLSSVVIATVIFLVIVMSGSFLNRVLGKRGLVALERLMGMILITLAVQMFLHGVLSFMQATKGV